VRKLDLVPGGAAAPPGERFEHRRGGDTILHHRTLNPVVIRD